MLRPKHNTRPVPASCRLAVLAASLLTADLAAAQSLTYGPILGRGYTPDQMLVHWGTGSANDATAVAYRKKGDSNWQMVSGAATRDHELTLGGLTAGTTYEYEVRSLAGNPVGATFTTCPLPGRPMDFVFYGDSRSGASEHATIVAQVSGKAPEMVFESGDIVADGSYSRYLSEFFPTVQMLARSTPFMAAPGNHDASANLATNFGLLFPAPRPAGAAWQSYYSFTCGNALFLGLDSNSAGDATQLKFVTDHLQAARNDATIDHVLVWLHHAPYSVGLHGDNSTVQSQWVPLFNDPQNKVSAVFAGHDHLYARMNDGSNVLYIVSGGAGAGLYPELATSKAKKVVAKSAFNFVAVHLAATTLSGVAYDDTGTPIDHFMLTKGSPPTGDDTPDMASSGGNDAGTDGGADLAVTPPPPAGGCAVAAPGSAASTDWLGAALLLGLVALWRRARRTA
jgi:MYXO-CTERM domain-containing protein